MINDADLDGNKMLDFHEFLSMMQKQVMINFLPANALFWKYCVATKTEMKL